MVSLLIHGANFRFSVWLIFSSAIRSLQSDIMGSNPQSDHNFSRNSGIFSLSDPRLDPWGVLPTHTFCGVPKSRKSPKRPALPGAVIRCGRSPTHTLSPACFSPSLPALIRAFPEERNPRVSQGAIRWLGSATGAHTGLFGSWTGCFPRPGEKLRTQGHTGRNRRDWVSFRW